MNLDPDPLLVGHAGVDARLKKGPTVHSTAWIVPGATIIGDVTLEEESSVWYGAVLGSPAKIRRQLTLDEQKDLARWALSYVETSKHLREFHSKKYCRASVSEDTSLWEARSTSSTTS